MKKPLITLIAFLAINFTFSQVAESEASTPEITIGKISNHYKYIELTRQTVDEENLYTLKYQNLEFPQMTDLAFVKFSATDEELDYLYNEILKGSKMKKTDPVNYISLGDGKMGITRLASGQVRILYTENGSTIVKWTWMSKGQLRKFFGK